MSAVPVESFLLTLAAILVAAKMLGALAQRIGQPAVLGEMVAGVLLGSSAIALLPTTGSLHEVVALLAEVGVVLLLFEIGLDTDLRAMFRVGASAVAVAVVGVVLPFALGYALWSLWQPQLGGPPSVSMTTVAVFVGATLTATSVGITSRVLGDMKRLGTPEARIIMGAAIVDDVLGLVILAIVSGIAAGTALSIAGIALKLAIAVGFLVSAILLGRWIMPFVFERLDRIDLRGILVVSAFAFALALAALAGKAGSAVIIGAFAAGIILSSTNQFDFITHRIQPIADIFAPIFFVYVGSNVDVGLLNPLDADFDPSVLSAAGALLVVAIIGKVVGGYVVGWGSTPLNHLAIGVGMIPRGEVGLIFAQLGLDGGIIGDKAFNAIVLVVMATTFLAPPLLKHIFARPDLPDAIPKEGLV